MSIHEFAALLAPAVTGRGTTPVAHGLVEAVWEAVIDGTLATGSRLPTTRELAITLGVSPRSVERAYEELERRGVVATQAGAGTFVALAPPSEAEHARHRAFAAFCRDTVARAAELGFDLDDLLDALAEYRTARHDSPGQDLTP